MADSDLFQTESLFSLNSLVSEKCNTNNCSTLPFNYDSPCGQAGPIVVYLLTDRPSNPQVAELIRYFQSSPFFHLRVTNLPPPATIYQTANMTTHQAVEIYRFNCVLTQASQLYPDQYVLVIKDTSVTSVSPLELQRVILTAQSWGEWNFCYLTRWLDRCELYRQPMKVPLSMTVLVQTRSPNGTQAILFSPAGRDLVIGRRKLNNGQYFTPIIFPLSTQLNQVIEAGLVTAICSVPNQFEFDVFQASSTTDLAKLADCRRPDVSQSRVNPIPFFWFIVIIIIIILLAWAFYIIGPSRYSSTTTVNTTGQKLS